MNIGNSLNVDGSITASGRLGGGEQAVSAGDAVLLDENGLIPASLLPNTGGETWERIAYNSTLVVGDVYRIRCIFGEVTFVYNNTGSASSSSSIYFPNSVNGSSSSATYRVVHISTSHKISDFKSYMSSTSSYTFEASDATCRLYHLVE